MASSVVWTRQNHGTGWISDYVWWGRTKRWPTGYLTGFGAGRCECGNHTSHGSKPCADNGKPGSESPRPHETDSGPAAERARSYCVHIRPQRELRSLRSELHYSVHSERHVANYAEPRAKPDARREIHRHVWTEDSGFLQSQSSNCL